MLLSAMLVGATHAAFEQGEEALDRVGVGRSTEVFTLGVVDAAMLAVLPADDLGRLGR